ncbi:hypothetical protein ETB97_002199 [Aspergillus alliaceus]|uniref:Methyltransferase type 11 domain-containing protein n=1 Tax=Petromyces alliaceus TaxID=209559 RepID=A0A8H6A4W4_PETAA|nr:hypothetical protein ETB97_002199 [Aspergillus burnettii]
MLDNARSQTRADDQSGFHVVDSTKPFNEGTSDLVLAAWLLNYAAIKEELLALWQNIFHSLKPGGRFIGVIPSSGILQTPSSARRYYFEGVSAEALECVAEGIRTKITLHATEPITFSCYVLEHRLYKKCAWQAGIRDLKWEPLPNDLRVDCGGYECLPSFQIVSASRPKMSVRDGVSL